VMIHDIEKCLAVGMDAHIGKPFEVEDFYGTLLEVLHVNVAMKPKPQSIAPKSVKTLFAKQEAIKRLGGNEALWEKLFRSFFETYLQLPERLHALIAAENRITLMDYVHTTKGLSGTVGLIQLEQSLGVFERSLKEQNSFENLPLETVLKEHHALMSVLQSEYEKLSTPSSLKQIHFSFEEKKVLESLLVDLQMALELSNVSKVTFLLEQLLSHGEVAGNAVFKELLFTCKQFDFEAALHHVERLSEEISNG